MEAAGADLLLICTNTMHAVADQVQAAIGIPLLHLADATAEAVRAAGRSTVGLLGTAFTMERAFSQGAPGPARARGAGAREGRPRAGAPGDLRGDPRLHVEAALAQAFAD